jgi:hypothetical protein
MNEFTAKNEQAFLDACGAIGVEAQEVANGIDRMISAPNSVHRVLIRA